MTRQLTSTLGNIVREVECTNARKRTAVLLILHDVTTVVCICFYYIYYRPLDHCSPACERASIAFAHALATSAACSNASRRLTDLGSRYGRSPRLTERVPVRLFLSRSWVAASIPGQPKWPE